MKAIEFKQAFAIADDETIDNLIGTEDTSIFDGFGLSDFKPVACTLHQVAALIRWQGQYLFGGWDMEAVNQVREHGRKKFIIVGC